MWLLTTSYGTSPLALRKVRPHRILLDMLSCGSVCCHCPKSAASGMGWHQKIKKEVSGFGLGKRKRNSEKKENPEIPTGLFDRAGRGGGRAGCARWQCRLPLCSLIFRNPALDIIVSYL